MDIRDTISIVITYLVEKKVRTSLTVLMVVVGIASIVALTSITAGVSSSVQQSLQTLGPTSIFIIPAGKTILTSTDVANLETLQNVSSVTPIVTGGAVLNINGQNLSTTIIGITTNGIETLLSNPIDLYQGSLYSDGLTPAVIIGHDIAYSSSFNPNIQTVSTGQSGTLEIQEPGSRIPSKISTQVTGILNSYGSSLIPIDSGIFMSLPYAELLLHKNSYSEIVVKANNARNVSSLTSLLEIIYGGNARIINTQQLANTISSVVGQISLLFIIIGGVSLLVASIGIMNIMLMAVSDKVHDIGILKSVGFKNREVLRIFLFQALAIGLLGGLIGIAAGMGAAYAISYVSTGALRSGSPNSSPTSAQLSPGGGVIYTSSSRSPAKLSDFGPAPSSTPGTTPSSLASIHPIFTAYVILEAIIIAVVISAMAGIYPAWKASKMEPIDALRTL